ncbi:MAG: hypothetical protein OSJ70_01075 [Bacilli bacterium]|nr:hypothetical protein [Bacilli bacterium]
MKAYGYDKNDEEYDKIIELSQVTLSCNKFDIDKIINFLIEVKKEMGNKKVEDEYHWHYRDYNDSWNESESDLIIFTDESRED